MGSSTLLLSKTKSKNEVMTFSIIVYLFLEKKDSIQFSMKLQSSSLFDMTDNLF
jgi:hypothetical protein